MSSLVYLRIPACSEFSVGATHFRLFLAGVQDYNGEPERPSAGAPCCLTHQCLSTNAAGEPPIGVHSPGEGAHEDCLGTSYVAQILQCDQVEVLCA
jgi:hypothetical protein